jgi:hypothetical protein
MVMGQIAKLIMDRDQNPIYVPFLTTELETLAPFSAISNIPAH